MTTYTVTVSAIFEAESYEDAVLQMAALLAENCYHMGYRVSYQVKWSEERSVEHSVFIDADELMAKEHSDGQ